MRSLTTLTIATALAAASVAGAMAQTTTYNATGTIYVGGKSNTEGTSLNGKSLYVASNVGDPGYAAFTILDFSGITTPANTDISSLSLSIANYPASYDISGPFDVFLTGASSLTGAEGYTYQTAGTDGIGTQLGTLVNLGPATYDATEAKSTTDTFTFNLSAAAQTLLSQDLNSGNVEFALGVPTTSSTTAQFDGIYYAPVTLTTTAAAATNPVPEASTTVSFGLLLALGLGGFAVASRRKVSAK